VTALLGYLNLNIPVFCFLRTLTDAWTSVSFMDFKCSLHPTGPCNASLLAKVSTRYNIMHQIFIKALASPAYMAAMPCLDVIIKIVDIHLSSY